MTPVRGLYVTAPVVDPAKLQLDLAEYSAVVVEAAEVIRVVRAVGTAKLPMPLKEAIDRLAVALEKPSRCVCGRPITRIRAGMGCTECELVKLRIALKQLRSITLELGPSST